MGIFSLLRTEESYWLSFRFDCRNDDDDDESDDNGGLKIELLTFKTD